MALEDKAYEAVASSTTVSERGSKGRQRAVTRALWADWIPGATTAALRSGRVRKALQGRWA